MEDRTKRYIFVGVNGDWRLMTEIILIIVQIRLRKPT